MTVVSPWSRGGWVNSQVFDHTSVIRFLEVVTGVDEPNISAWRREVCGDLTSCFDFSDFDPTVPTLPDLTKVLRKANREQTLPGPVAPTGTQTAPKVEAGTRPQRSLPYQPDGTVAIDRTKGTVTVSLANGGSAGMSFHVFAATVSPFQAVPVVVAAKGSNSYAFDASTTDGDYDLTVLGANGFLRRFAGQVVPTGQDSTGVPAVTATTAGGKLTLTLSNAGATQVRFTMSRNQFAGSSKTTYVDQGKSTKVTWPLQDGWYDVTVTANVGTGFSYRFAGRIEA